MTLRHLKLFVTVYQCNSITQAAKLLHIAQPSVSLAIAQLESNYNTKMFDRISKRIYPTESGKKFYEYALHIVTLSEKMESEILNWDYPSMLKVGASTTIGSYILPQIAAEFKVLSPDIKVSVTINNSAAIRQNVIDNTIDFALIEAEPIHPKLNCIPFIRDRLCMACSPNHPLANRTNVTLQELASYDFLLSEKGTANRDFFETLLSYHKISLQPVWESISHQTIVSAALHGLGISFLPYLQIKKELLSGNLKEISLSGLDLSRNYYIVYHQNKYLSPSAKTFIQLCQTMSHYAF